MRSTLCVVHSAFAVLQHSVLFIDILPWYQDLGRQGGNFGAFPAFARSFSTASREKLSHDPDLVKALDAGFSNLIMYFNEAESSPASNRCVYPEFLVSIDFIVQLERRC